MAAKRRHLKYSDEGNAIIDELLAAGVPAHAYIDALLREADSTWRESLARLQSFGWSAPLLNAAISALGVVDGTETAAIALERLRKASLDTVEIEQSTWDKAVATAKRDMGVLRALHIMSRANARGLGPLLRRSMGAY